MVTAITFARDGLRRAGVPNRKIRGILPDNYRCSALWLAPGCEYSAAIYIFLARAYPAYVGPICCRDPEDACPGKHG